MEIIIFRLKSTSQSLIDGRMGVGGADWRRMERNKAERQSANMRREK